MRTSLLIVLFVFIYSAPFCQTTKFEILKEPEVMELQIFESSKETGNDSILYGRIELSYDFINQYPYYKIFASKEDSVSLNITLKKLPSTGFVYVYALNVPNSPQMRAIFEVDKASLANGKKQTFTISISKISYFVVSFANKEITDMSERLKDMELTFGSFLFRQNSILGNELLWPNRKWHFLPVEKLGFEIEKGLVSGEIQFIVPITFKIMHEL